MSLEFRNDHFAGIKKKNLSIGISKSDKPHRRYNPLTGEWVLVTSHRTSRPWLGQEEEPSVSPQVEYDPDCFLCPGNVRANGERNANYRKTFVFTNDFSALLPDIPERRREQSPLIQVDQVRGICKVICFSPHHSKTLAELPEEGIMTVVDAWIEQSQLLGQNYRWVQIFENKGEIMGCSNPHPHCQIWATGSLPNEARKEDINQSEYFRKYRSPMLLDYLKYEIGEKKRIVAENGDWVVVVPFWAVWPFETLLLPRRHVLRLAEIHDSEKVTLAEILKVLLSKYDNLFRVEFPYSMGWHGAPHDENANSHWQLHAHYYPPLLRSSTVKKFMVGYEMLAEPQRDISPETAAQRLRNLADTRTF